MVFLNPSILLGLLASLIPVIIHLLNLRKLKRIEFSTLDFLKELQKNKIKRIKIKQWILLALRVLIILFLVASFARPTIETSSLGGTSAAKTTAVFVLDDSPSMSVIGAHGNYFNYSRETIKNILAQLNEGDDLSLFTLSGTEKFSSVNSDNFLDVVDNTKITDISGSPGRTFNHVLEYLKQSDNFNKELYLFSDRQHHFFENDSVFANLANGLSDLNARTYFFDVSGSEYNNVGISQLKSVNQIFELNKAAGFSAIVTNYGSVAEKNVVASLSINGKKVARQSVDVNPGESKLVSFQTNLDDTGFLNITASIENDEFEKDDNVYLSIYVPEKINVGLFYEKQTDILYLNPALYEAETNESFNVVRKPIQQITSVNINVFEVIILVGNIPEGNSDLLNNYSENGGGIIWFPSTGQLNAENPNITIPGNNQIAVSIITDKNGIEYSIANMELSHPVFTNLFQQEKRPKPAPIRLFSFLKYNAPADFLEIIKFEDGTPLLAENRIGKGKTLVYNVAPDLTSSDFPLTGMFAPLVNKGIYYLTNTNETDTTWFSGNKVILNTSNYPYSNVRVELPDGNSLYLPADSVKNKNYLEISETAQTGFYKLFSEEKQVDCFAVNLETKESQTLRVSEDELKDKFNSDVLLFNFLTPEDNYREAIVQARFGTELWRYFLIIALILAVIEMLLARNSKKDLADLQ